jgi:DNA replication initiation complex subunit (GINS family)
VELIQDFPDFFDESISVIFAPSRNEHGDHKSCHSGVNSRAEHSNPNAKTKKGIEERPPDPKEVGDNKSQDEKNADNEVAPDDLFGVEESDNDYCSQVVRWPWVFPSHLPWQCRD